MNGKFTECDSLSLNDVAGEEQRHFVENAFNILVNEGFLRDEQGVHTLEAVQKIHEIIQEPMREATMEWRDLNSYCPAGKFTLFYQAVITLVYQVSQSDEIYYHAVRVSIILIKLIFRFSIFQTIEHPIYSYSKRNKLGTE